MLCKCLTLLGERLQAKLLLTVLKKLEALLDADDPFKDLQEQLDKLAVYNPSSSKKELPLLISSLWMILSPALSH